MFARRVTISSMQDPTVKVDSPIDLDIVSLEDAAAAAGAVGMEVKIC